ncbi:MAG: endonuclease I family protein [Flavobacteriales bacterium]
MKKIPLLLSSILIAFSCSSDDEVKTTENRTLDIVDGIIEPLLKDQELRSELRYFYRIDDNKSLGYTKAREYLYSDLFYQGGKLEGIYSGYQVSINLSEGNYINQAGRQGVNCEHSFPQSKGAGQEPMRSDMHHLYPEKGTVNEIRSNFKFMDITDSSTYQWILEGNIYTTIPSTNIDAYSEALNGGFEPREKVKGDVARAIMYFYTMYNSADPLYFRSMLDTLIKWNQLDLVSEEERVRNQKIKAYQGNENPYILDETLADRAFNDL